VNDANNMSERDTTSALPKIGLPQKLKYIETLMKNKRTNIK